MDGFVNGAIVGPLVTTFYEIIIELFTPSVYPTY